MASNRAEFSLRCIVVVFLVLCEIAHAQEEGEETTTASTVQLTLPTGTPLEVDQVEREAYLDDARTFLLRWRFVNATHVAFTMRAATVGWLALGVSDRGDMSGADIAFAWVDDATNETFIQVGLCISDAMHFGNVAAPGVPGPYSTYINIIAYFQGRGTSKI